MPADLTAQAAELAVAYAVVAVAAGPVGLVGWLASRPVGPARPAGGWTAVDAVLLFFVHQVLTPAVVLAAFGLRLEPTAAVGGAAAAAASGADVADHVAVLTAAAAGAAAMLAVAFALWVGRGKPGRRPAAAATARRVAAGVGGWLAVTPVVLAVHLAATWAVSAAGGRPDPHPLTRVDLTNSPAVALLFVVVVCGLTPLAEEFLCRRVLLGWAARRPGRAAGLTAAAGLLAALADGRGLGLAAALAVGHVAVGRARRHDPTARAVYATAAVFAAAHANVWPSPLPLFVLGLALGWLTVRFGGLAPAVVCHGLFNAVSAVYLLRGGP